MHAVAFVDYADAVAAYDANGSGDLDSAAEVEAAIQGGAATDEGVVEEVRVPRHPRSA